MGVRTKEWKNIILSEEFNYDFINRTDKFCFRSDLL